MRDTFRAIHATLPKLEAKEKVPLSDEPLAPPVDYEYLCKLERDGIEELPFEGTDRKYRVRDVLSGVDEFRFDVFLCHNSQDKPAVRELANLLRERGVRPWLDEWELLGGDDWHERLVEAFDVTPCIAVLIGARGGGPWQNAEMQLALDANVKKQKRLIPILLPEVKHPPVLMGAWRFLNRLHWVDFRSGFKETELGRLMSAIRR